MTYLFELIEVPRTRFERTSYEKLQEIMGVGCRSLYLKSTEVPAVAPYLFIRHVSDTPSLWDAHLNLISESLQDVNSMEVLRMKGILVNSYEFFIPDSCSYH